MVGTIILHPPHQLSPAWLGEPLCYLNAESSICFSSAGSWVLGWWMYITLQVDKKRIRPKAKVSQPLCLATLLYRHHGLCYARDSSAATLPRWPSRARSTTKENHQVWREFRLAYVLIHNPILHHVSFGICFKICRYAICMYIFVGVICKPRSNLCQIQCRSIAENLKVQFSCLILERS